VSHVLSTLWVSERRACKALAVPRSAHRFRPKRPDRDRLLVRRLHHLSEAHPRYGYRRITALLRSDGWLVNRKRVQRLWRLHGLRVPPRTVKRLRLGTAEQGCARLRAERPHDVWAVDFVMDTTADGGRLKLLTVVDEATRYALSVKVSRRLTGQDVALELERLMTLHGAPKHVRSDNGPEFVARAVRGHLAQNQIESLLIAPGSPWQNGHAESFHARLRDECLNLELFTSLFEAQVVIEKWRQHYNQARPHGALNYRTPSQVLGQKPEVLAAEIPTT